MKVKVTESKILCDMCRTKVEARTILIHVNGTSRKVDLCEMHEARLKKALKPFLAKSRPARIRRGSSNGATSSARGKQRKSGAASPQEMRDWARGNGWKNIKDRGRVPQEVVKDFEQHHQAA